MAQIVHHKGDLFEYCGTGTEIILVHCISQDAKMGKGIATKFKKKFPKMQKEILSVKPKIGDVIPHSIEVMSKKGREKNKTIEIYSLNMITKKNYFDKPTQSNFDLTVQTLRNTCDTFGFEEIAMPKIGCGLDRLDWDNFVLPCLNRHFSDLDVKIHVYSI